MIRLAKTLGVAAAGALLAACFEPAIPEGYACGPDQACPPGQSCVDGTCRLGAADDDGDGDDEPGNDDGGRDDGDGGDDNEPADDCDDEPWHDEDGDGVHDACDNCPAHANEDQSDERDGGDGVGDACDPNPESTGDRILYFESFDNDLDAWRQIGEGDWDLGNDEVDQDHAFADEALLVLRSVHEDTVTVDVGAALEEEGNSAVGLYFGPAVAVVDDDDPSGYACVHSVLAGVSKLAIVDLDSPLFAPLVHASAPEPELNDESRYRITMGGGEIVCEYEGEGTGVRVSKGEPGQRGQIGLFTAEAGVEFEYVVVYGRR